MGLRRPHTISMIARDSGGLIALTPQAFGHPSVCFCKTRSTNDVPSKNAPEPYNNMDSPARLPQTKVIIQVPNPRLRTGKRYIGICSQGRYVWLQPCREPHCPCHRERLHKDTEVAGRGSMRGGKTSAMRDVECRPVVWVPFVTCAAGDASHLSTFL